MKHKPARADAAWHAPTHTRVRMQSRHEVPNTDASSLANKNALERNYIHTRPHTQVPTTLHTCTTYPIH
eukprot:3643554-Pleurochrysis_carterae.AAC.7